MGETDISEKHVIVHIGPHKTGSTAIQSCLAANQEFLRSSGLCYLHSADTHRAAMLLADEAFVEAEVLLGQISQQISDMTASTILMSHEDFCGHLPGRSRKKLIYPKLTKNLRTISRALLPHRVTFVFFTRNEGEWLESCYHQHLKHRTNFSNFKAFDAYFSQSPNLDARLQKLKLILGDSFITENYRKELGAGVNALLEISGFKKLILPFAPELKNSSPSREKIKLLERINSLSSFRSTAWFAKALALRDRKPRSSNSTAPIPVTVCDSLAFLALPDLTRRVKSRFRHQKLDDILPDPDVNLNDYVFRVLPEGVELTEATRANIQDQSKILDYHLRGKSHLAKLNALTISYLRRDTQHTEKARNLFHRIWEEHGVLLINELSTRWLISTLQTFLDHGRNEEQRTIGACGYFYANMMKIYEGERSIEGLEQDGIYNQMQPQTPNKFPGLDRFVLGGTDLLLNTNALALELSMRDDTAGIVLQEFLLRVKQSENVFSRMDRTRQARGIVVDGFADTWTFFVSPSE